MAARLRRTARNRTIVRSQDVTDGSADQEGHSDNGVALLLLRRQRPDSALACGAGV